jgi:tRNA dimethylallyltransferase
VNISNEQPVAVITGATATGKTEVAVLLAMRVGGEIISADSRQVYRGVSVGTAKPAGMWRNGCYVHHGIPHHLMDFLDLREEYNAGMFARDASRYADDVRRRRRTPIIVGGTGFYISAYANGLSALPPRDYELRARLLAIAQRDGPERLHGLLAQRDPERAAQIHPRNTHRIIRALEIVLSAGMTVAQVLRTLPVPERRAVSIAGIAIGRDNLRRRIAERTRRMFATGLVEETESLLAKGMPADTPGFTAIGYRHVIAYVRGSISREDALERTTRDTIRYARAQQTWFRRDKHIVWFDADDLRPAALAERLHNHFVSTGAWPDGEES